MNGLRQRGDIKEEGGREQWRDEEEQQMIESFKT